PALPEAGLEPGGRHASAGWGRTARRGKSGGLKPACRPALVPAGHDGNNGRPVAGVKSITEPRSFAPDRDILASIVSANLHGRHLKEGQRAMLATEIANRKHGGDRMSDQEAHVPLDPEPAVSLGEAAKLIGVRRSSVRHAQQPVTVPRLIY